MYKMKLPSMTTYLNTLLKQIVLAKEIVSRVILKYKTISFEYIFTLTTKLYEVQSSIFYTTLEIILINDAI